MSSAVEVVLDTVCLQHLLRRPRVRRARSGPRSKLETTLDGPIQNKSLRLVVDAARGLIGEWEQTCGREVVGVVINRWEIFGGIVVISDVPRIPASVSKRLRHLGFAGTIDRLILRLALGAKDRTVVSNDTDFWDPSNTTRPGDPQAPVARLVRQELSVTVLLLITFVRTHCR
jgi:hypothetical protein